MAALASLDGLELAFLIMPIVDQSPPPPDHLSQSAQAGGARPLITTFSRSTIFVCYSFVWKLGTERRRRAPRLTQKV